MSKVPPPAKTSTTSRVVPLRPARAVFGWLRHELVAGLVLTAFLALVGIANANAGGDAQRAFSLAGLMALVFGMRLVLAGTVRLDFVTALLSKPIRYGYINGIALTLRPT